MKLTELIAQHLIEAHEGNNWTDVSIKDAIADIGYKEATTETNASHNTIAGLVHHLSFYNDVVTKRLFGNIPVIGESNGFDVPAIVSEEDWKKLKDRNIKSAAELAAAVRAFPENKLFELTVTGTSTHYKMLHGIVEHAHYHLGQIVLLKNLIRATKLAG
jgi:uncharacterized damage-inducible protein DinB